MIRGFFLILFFRSLVPSVFAFDKPGIFPCTNALRKNFFPFEMTELSEKSWIDKKFTYAYLAQLKPIEHNENVLGLKLDDLISISFLEYKNSRGTKVDFETKLFTRGLAGSEQVVPVISMRCGRVLCGILVLSIERNDKGQLIAVSEYLKTDPKKMAIQGIGVHIMPMLRDYYKRLGVQEERLEAGWSGRELWAKEGFRLAEDVKFSEDGKMISQRDLIKGNFLRFLNVQNISLTDLVYVTQDGQSYPLDQSLSRLNQPIDFTRVFHKSGKKIMTRSYVDVDVLSGSRPMSVGLAFTHWDYRPRQNQPVVVLQGSKLLSDIAMPTWIGVRDL